MIPSNRDYHLVSRRRVFTAMDTLSLICYECSIGIFETIFVFQILLCVLLKKVSIRTGATYEQKFAWEAWGLHTLHCAAPYLSHAGVKT